jgi:AcrR family transcriptional regulator
MSIVQDMTRGTRAAPGHKLTSKGMQTRQRIIAAAADLVFTRGVAGMTMEDVRGAAGVSSSQIYHYFADKEALVQAVIAYRSETIVGSQEAMLARLDSLAGLREWRDFVVAHQRTAGGRGGCPIGSLGSELAEIDPRARVAVATAFRRWESGIRRGYQAMRDRGELAPGADPGRLATATLAALQGGLLLAQVQRSTTPLEAALDTVCAHITSLAVPAPAATSGVA